MRARLLRIAKWLAYPAFYLLCLLLFAYLTFPYGQLKGRVIAEFNRLQQKQRRRAHSSGPPMQLEIDDLSGHWLTGIEVAGARLVIPPDRLTQAAVAKRPAAGKDQGKATAAPAASVITIKRATARVRLLPLLIGDVNIDFSIDVFGGQVEGTVPVGTDAGDVEVELSGLQLGQVQPLSSLLEGLPVVGALGGNIRLSPKAGKFAKADGTVELHVDDLAVADGKTKVQGVALPAAQLGQLVINATAKDGVLKIGEMGTQGHDLDLTGEGRIILRESWDRSRADILLKFRFADSYRDKSDATRSLLGKPGDKFPAAIELAPRSPFKRAKTADGYYQFQVRGPLAKLTFDPAGKGRQSRARARGRGKLGRPAAGLPKFGRGFGMRPSLGKGGPKRPTARPPAAGRDNDRGSAPGPAGAGTAAGGEADDNPTADRGAAGQGRPAAGEHGGSGDGDGASHGAGEAEQGKDNTTRGE